MSFFQKTSPLKPRGGTPRLGCAFLLSTAPCSPQRLIWFRRTRGPGEQRSGGRPLAARVETARGDHVSPDGQLPTVCRAARALLRLTGSALTCPYRAQETAP